MSLITYKLIYKSSDLIKKIKKFNHLEEQIKALKNDLKISKNKDLQKEINELQQQKDNILLDGFMKDFYESLQQQKICNTQPKKQPSKKYHKPKL